MILSIRGRGERKAAGSYLDALWRLRLPLLLGRDALNHDQSGAGPLRMDSSVWRMAVSNSEAGRLEAQRRPCGVRDRSVGECTLTERRLDLGGPPSKPLPS